MLFKALSKIPVLGVVLVIVNSYVWGGNFQSEDQFAPIGRWITALTPALSIAITLTVWMLWPAVILFVADIPPCMDDLAPIARKPGEIAVSVLPNVLGFGIGVYALIFVLSEKLLNSFHKTISAGSGSTALAINADMAFPLLVMLLSICVGLFQQRYPESVEWVFASWFVLWYALVLALCLISSLFRLGEVSIVEKIVEDNPGDNEDRS